MDLKLRWVGGSFLRGVGGCPSRESAGDGCGRGSLVLMLDSSSCPQGRGSHHVRLLQVIDWTSHDLSRTTSSLPPPFSKPGILLGVVRLPQYLPLAIHIQEKYSEVILFYNRYL